MSNGGTNQAAFAVSPASMGTVAGVVPMSLDVNNNPQAAGPQSGLPVYDSFLNPVTLVWNSSTPLNTAQSFLTTGMDCVALTIIPSGTITTGAVTFEVFDGYNWFPIKSARESSYNTDSVFNAAGSTQTAWTIPCAAYPDFRVRLSTALTGTAPVLQIAAVVSSAPDTSIVTAGLDPQQPLHPGALTLQAQQVVAIGAASASSAVVGANTNRVALTATAACWVAFGASPTAVANTTGNTYIPANAAPIIITVTPGVTKVANIQAASGGYLSINESL